MSQPPLMLREIFEAPAAIAHQLRENEAAIERVTRAISERGPAYAVTVARGSSDHACTALQYALATSLGLPVASLGPSVHTLYGAPLKLEGALLIAASQSGASPDVVETVQAAREAGALTVALVNREDSPLAHTAEFTLPLRCGPEQAVAATKSYLATLSAFLPVLAKLSQDAALSAALQQLPATLQRALALQAEARALAQRYCFARHMIILARGHHFGVALESALKLKETCGIHAEAYSAAEFSHGPKRLLAEGNMPFLGYLSDDQAAEAARATYADLRQSGADLRTLGPAADALLRTPQSGHPLTDTTVSAQTFYLFTAHLALSKGLNPDSPPLLSKVTKTR